VWEKWKIDEHHYFDFEFITSKNVYIKIVRSINSWKTCKFKSWFWKYDWWYMCIFLKYYSLKIITGPMLVLKSN